MAKTEIEVQNSLNALVHQLNTDTKNSVDLAAVSHTLDEVIAERIKKTIRSHFDSFSMLDLSTLQAVLRNAQKPRGRRYKNDLK